MNRNSFSAFIARGVTATGKQLSKLLICQRKDVTADYVVRDILFSDLNRLHEIEDNLKNLQVPEKPEDGYRESRVARYKRKVAESQKKSYLKEIIRLNEKIYGVPFSGSGIKKHLSKRPQSQAKKTLNRNTQPSVSSTSSSLCSSTSSYSSSLGISVYSQKKKSDVERFVSEATAHNERMDAVIKKFARKGHFLHEIEPLAISSNQRSMTEIVNAKNESLKSQLEAVAVEKSDNAEQLMTERVEIKSPADNKCCCTRLHETLEESKRLKMALEKVTRERDALKSERGAATKEDCDKDLQTAVSELAESARRLTSWGIESVFDQDIPSSVRQIREEYGGGDCAEMDELEL